MQSEIDIHCAVSKSLKKCLFLEVVFFIFILEIFFSLSLLRYFDKKKQAAKKEQKTMEASKKVDIFS